MTHNEFRHNGLNISHRSLADKNLCKMDVPVVRTLATLPTHLSFKCRGLSWIIITRHYKATGNSIRCTGGIIPETVGDIDYITADR